MAGSRELTEEQRRRVQERVRELLVDRTQDELALEMGMKQPTISAAARTGKVGYKTAEAVARYLGISVDDLMNGTESAGYYTSHEMKYPNRGVVLDGLRRVLPKEVIREVLEIELPARSADWTRLEWLSEIVARANRWERLHKTPDSGVSNVVPLVPKNGHPEKK